MRDLSCIKRMKFVPMLVAPFLSLLRTSMQSRCVQRRSPRILFFLILSNSSHGPHSPKHLQHVLLVYASGVGATTKCLESFFISPTPRHGGLPLLQAAPGFPATIPHEPYANTTCFPSVFKSLSFLYKLSSDF